MGDNLSRMKDKCELACKINYLAYKIK